MGLYEEIKALYDRLREQKREKYRRRVSFGDLFTERDENARFYGFGEGTTCYDNVLILGDVKVGKHTWIGPNVVLDGSGGLEIGDHCTISSGVQIYSHNTVEKTLSGGKAPMALSPTKIGSRVYIGPQSIIEMGVTVGDRVVIGAMSLVNKDIESGSRAWGSPARIISKNDS